jgi:hypothetical protein
MKFARFVFWTAGVWGLLIVIPLYFTFNTIGRQDPPAITHPQFYFGFLGVTLAWQVAFFLIAANPDRFRPMIIPALIEKLTYVGTITALLIRRQMSPSESLVAVPDLILTILFAISFAKTRPVLAHT